MANSSVLIVCLGNICRSPLAEAAFRQAAQDQGIALEVDSAGTANYHQGNPPDPRAIKVAKAQGLDISAYRARQVQAEDFTRFDHILAADQDVLNSLQSTIPAGATAKLALLLDHVPGRKGQPVSDPYYGEDKDFERCWLQVFESARIWLTKT